MSLFQIGVPVAGKGLPSLTNGTARQVVPAITPNPPTAQMRGEKGGSRPVSRVLSRTAIHLRRASPHASSDLPGNSCGHTAIVPLFGLASGGVYPATGVTTCAVRSYRTISPLPASRPAVYFLRHFPWAHAPQALPGTLPNEARTFLRDFSRRLPGRLPRIDYQSGRSRVSL